MTPPRRRACEACHVAKVRCELSLARPNTTAPCQRCRRLAKDCAPAAPRRQKHRIAQLEAQVDELLGRGSQSQAVLPTAPSVPLVLPDFSVLVRDLPSNQEQSFTALRTDILAFLDTLDQQQAACYAYARQNVSTLPLVPIESAELQSLRKRCPILLLSILAFPTAGIIQGDVQRQLVEKAMQVLATSFIGAGYRSLELVKALVVATIWFRGYSKAGQGVVHQLVQTAVNVAVDIGICGQKQTCVLTYDLWKDEHLTSLDARRTWLACFLASSSISTVMRRPDTNHWAPYHESCLQHLLTASDSLPSDRLLYHIVYAEKLCHRVTSRLSLLDAMVYKDVNETATKVCVSELRQEIEDWQAQIPEDVRSASLDFGRYAALIYLNELILHTPTNKSTFASPFLPDNIRPDDFAAPIVTVDHVSSLYAILDACHAALDLALGLDSMLTFSLSPIMYTPRVLYATFILVKLYVAVTAPGNTYGAVLNRSELRLEDYFQKAKTLSLALNAIDPGSCHTMLISAHAWLEQWFVEYKTIVDQYEQRLSEGWRMAPARLSFNDKLGKDVVSTVRQDDPLQKRPT